MEIARRNLSELNFASNIGLIDSIRDIFVKYFDDLFVLFIDSLKLEVQDLREKVTVQKLRMLNFLNVENSNCQSGETLKIFQCT